MTITDRRGLATSAASAAEATAFDDAFDRYLDYEMAAGGAVKQVLADHPGSVLGAVLRGSMMMMLETRGVYPKVAQLAADGLAELDHATERECLHLEALARWADGDVLGAADVWDRILASHPLDLLALKLHHYTTFWTGRAPVLLATVDGVIDAWEPTTPGYDRVLGMRAFALNENGRYDEAEALGREAIAESDDDLWSVHAVAHALEMRGDHRAGRQLLDPGDGDRWATKNPFVGHLWWHAALFEWHSGDYDAVLDLYDRRVRPANTEFYLDLQNLSSLLRRLELSGVEVGDRWDELVDHAVGRIGDHVLTFTDAHVALTLSRADRRDELASLRESLRRDRDERAATLAAADVGSGRTAVALAGCDVVIQLADALADLAAGRAEPGAEALTAIRGDLAPIGGSHAQRDLFDLVTAEAVAAAGDGAGAIDTFRARSRRWPSSVPTWRRLGELLAEAGEGEAATDAARRAMEVSSS